MMNPPHRVHSFIRGLFVLLSVLVTSCREHSPPTPGQWIGDARGEVGVERLEIAVDSSRTSAQVTMPSWRLAAESVERVPSTRDSVLFIGVVDGDTVRLTGTADAGHWAGAVARGDRQASFELRRVFDLSEAEHRALVGSYRTTDGGLLGIALFSEFGSRPMVVDYTNGRIGPLYPVSRSRLLVGRALVSPVLAADTLEVTRAGDGSVARLRLTQSGHPALEATRIPTRDEEVRFTNDSITLGGTLTLPVTSPPYPGLVLVHGSNALTRDVFGPWSRFFAGLGFAVLAYDKRGTGASTGDWKEADFPQLADDVLAGVRFLAARSDIDADRVGLWGISQAGWIMPIVAAEAPEEVAFMVVHAGTGTTVREQGLLNLQNELRAAGLGETSIAVGRRYQELNDRVTASGAGWRELQQFYEAHREDEPWLWPPQPADDWFRTYYRMLMDFDPAAHWRRVTCPVLLFFGELDANVPPAESWPPIERALRAAGNVHVTQIVLPRANHVLLEAQTGGRDEYPGLSRFVPGYFDRMAAWLATQTR